MDVVHTRQCPERSINIHKQLGKGNNYQGISGKFGVVASTAYAKENTTGTDENLFRLVPVPGHGARVLTGTNKRLCSDSGTKSEQGLSYHVEQQLLYFS